MVDNTNLYLKSAIIVDLGSGEVKAGFTGNEQIKVEFPNYIGEHKYKKILKGLEKDNHLDSKETYVGKDCDKYIGILKLRYPVKNGVFQSEQDIMSIFNHIYTKLEINSEEIKEHPILITEPLLNPYNHRRQIAKILFDNFNVPALSFGSQPIFSLWASGNKTGLVLESGEGVTQCCAVFDGYSIPHSYIRQNFAGRDVTEYLQSLFKRVGHSFNTTAEFEIVKRIKETLCYTLISNTYNDLEKKSTDTTLTNYFLPDGTTLPVKDEKVFAPEIMFNPSLIGSEYMPISDMVINCISKVDIDIRSTLYQHIILTGGNTNFKGMTEKLGNEIKKLAPKNMRVKLLALLKRKHSAWYGASILCSLSAFKNMWVTRNDYAEKGDRDLFVKSI